jgi:hypothetical protein
MPVFYYLTRQEAADIYTYLASYPPSELRFSQPLIDAPQQLPAEKDASLPLLPASMKQPAGVQLSHARLSAEIPDSVVTLCLISLGVLVIAVLSAALGFAAFELYRLGQTAERRTSHSSREEHLDIDAPELAMRYRESA